MDVCTILHKVDTVSCLSARRIVALNKMTTAKKEASPVVLPESARFESLHQPAAGDGLSAQPQIRHIAKSLLSARRACYPRRRDRDATHSPLRPETLPYSHGSRCRRPAATLNQK